MFSTLLNVFINISLVVIILSVLVFIHELGHFLAAKAIDAKVIEFAVGMGPKIFSFFIGETEYSLRIFPIGGYARIYGEEDEDDKKYKKEPKRSLANKTNLQKIFVMIAGVLMNLLLAVIIFFFLLAQTNFKIFLSNDYRNFNPIGATISLDRLGDVGYSGIVDGTPAKQFHLQNEGVIKSVDSKSLTYSYELKTILADDKGKVIVLNICGTDGNNCKDYSIKVGDDGKLGIYLYDNYVTQVDYTKYKYLAGFSHSINTLKILDIALSNIINTAKSSGDYAPVVNSVSGPVGVYVVVDKLKSDGYQALFELTANLSLTLFIMNLLPIPALDGGRILLIVIEMITRKKINRRLEAIIINVSFILLLLFIAVIMVKDIVFFKQMSALLK